MAEWRERGYVPDSDEEEDETFQCPRQSFEQVGQQANQSQISAGQDGYHMDLAEIDDAEPSYSPVVNELKATLELGLKQVGEVLLDSPRQLRSFELDRQSSSPLSSLGFLEDKLGKGFNDNESPARSSELALLEAQVEGSPSRSLELVPPPRALRQRTQIQLHPYVLEDARYQQELKARGLKPVRITASQGQQPQPRNSLFSGEDEVSLFSSSPAEEDFTPADTSLSPQGSGASDLQPSRNRGFRRSVSLSRNDDGDEDLPDLATIFRDDSPGRLLSNLKASRQSPTARTDKRAGYKLAGVYERLEGEKPLQNNSSGSATFFVPPSPPHSGNVSSSEQTVFTQAGERQRSTTPGRLPTPLVSSDGHPRKRSMVELVDLSQDMFGEAADAEQMLSSSEDDNASVGKIKAMRRRMRGVLPASWLKLDLKQQTGRAERSHNGQSAREFFDGKGVAKPASAAKPLAGEARPSSSSRVHPFHFDFSDEDQSSIEETGSDLCSADDKIGFESSDLFSKDVLEDNRVDTMQPARESRPKFASKPRRKRQQRISDTWGENIKGSKQQPGFSTKYRTSKANPPRVPKTKRQKRDEPAPLLSVLDAPDVAQLSKAHQPVFLKVALRRAQKQERHKTQSPGRKFFRLASESETQDINQNLVHWRDGRIRPHDQDSHFVPATGLAVDRSPLPQEITKIQIGSNLSTSFRAEQSTEDALTDLRRSTDATIQRVLFKQRGLTVFPPREPPLTSNFRTTSSTLKVYTGINFRKPLRNQTGLNPFQKVSSPPHAAHFEDIGRASSFPNLFHPLLPKRAAIRPDIGDARPLQNLTKPLEIDEPVNTIKPTSSERASKPNSKRQIRKARIPQITQMGPVPAQFAGLESVPVILDGQEPGKISDEAKIVTNLVTRLIRQGDSDADLHSWSALGPPLQRWLEVYLERKQTRTTSEKEQAREIFKCCYELVAGYKSSIWDDMIRKVAWFFSTCGMTDPFDHELHPYIGLPQFLDEGSLMTGPALPCAHDPAFHIFLSMLTISLTDKSRNASDTAAGVPEGKKRKIELQSFINRLYPNNGRMLSELEEVHETQLASLWNRCSMYMTLYCYTLDDCRPRLSQIQNLVDFSQSHMMACNVILSVWQVLALFHAKKIDSSQIRSLADLSEWIQGMIRAMLVKWSNAESEVVRQFQDRSMDEHAVYIVQTNQENVESFIRRALDTWAMAIRKCESETAAALLLSCPQLEQLLSRLTATFVYNDRVFQHILGVLEEYLHRYSLTGLQSNASAHGMMLTLISAIDKILVRRFGAEAVRKDLASSHRVNRRLTYIWYLVGTSMIVANDKSWDDFLEPAGKCAWERFTNEERSAQYKVLFVTYIIKSSENVYRDNKFWYLSFWLRTLLRPLDDWVFEHELTNAVLEADQYEPMLRNLPILLLDSVHGSAVTLFDLKYNRTAILERIVEGIAAASATYESQAVDPYALQPPEMADLLKLVMRTMKATRMDLAKMSNEQREYDQMIFRVAEKMDWCTNSIVPLDRWFRETDLIAMGRFTLQQRFGCATSAIRMVIVSKQDVIWFQHTCQKAAIEGSQDQICEVLNSVYVDASDVSETEWYFPKQLAMMQQVFPAYLELASSDAGALIGAPVLQCLDAICSEVTMRAVNIGTDDFGPLLDALYAIIVAARMALQGSNVDRAVDSIINPMAGTFQALPTAITDSSGARTQSFSYVLRIARIAVCQYHQVVRCAGRVHNRQELRQVAGHARYVHSFVRSLRGYLREGEEGHWKSLEAIEQYNTADADVNKVKRFAKEELEKALRTDWNKDSAGKWWVKQGREAVPINLGPPGVTTDPRLRLMVQNEMQAYVDMFEGTVRRNTESFPGGSAVFPQPRDMTVEDDEEDAGASSTAN